MILFFGHPFLRLGVGVGWLSEGARPVVASNLCKFNLKLGDFLRVGYLEFCLLFGELEYLGILLPYQQCLLGEPLLFREKFSLQKLVCVFQSLELRSVGFGVLSPSVSL